MADVWKDFPSGSQGLYGTNTALMSDGAYAVVTGALDEDPDPNVTGIVLRGNGGAQDVATLRKILPAPVTKVGCAFRLWQPGLAQQGWALVFNTNTSARQVSITSNSSGQLIVKTGSPRTGDVIAESPLNTITANAWINLEFEALAGEATGTIEVRREGVPIPSLTLTDVNTGAGPYSQVEFTHTGNFSGIEPYYKDLRIWDNTGGWGDTFPGNTQVIDLGPVSDISSGWSRTTGASDFAILDNVPPNDAEYIFAGEGPIPAPSIVGLADLPEDVTSVRSLMTIFRGKKSDGGDADVQTSLISNGLLDSGTNRPMTTAFTYYWDFSHLDPNTGAQWTPAGVDAADFQINRTL